MNETKKVKKKKKEGEITEKSVQTHTGSLATEELKMDLHTKQHTAFTLCHN